MIIMPAKIGAVPILQDTALWVALILALFTIAFGTRHLDAAEHHEGMVAAIAFESIVKLLAFVAVGTFVTFGIYNGFGDVFARAAAEPKLAALLTPLEGVAGGYASWVWLTILSMLAIMFLPRQFQIAVIENVDEKHLKKAIWLFPLYMLAINVFVLPLAFGGRLHFPDGSVDADTFVLTLPMAEKQEILALLVFIGGLSAATGMVIVETIALSTMVCNDLVMPVLLRLQRLRLTERSDLTGLLLGIRRGAIVLILLLGYLYFRLAGEAYALVSIGLISFAAVAQFAPAVLGRHLLEGWHAPRRAVGPDRRFRRLVLHAAAAGVRALGLAADGAARPRPVRVRAAEAARAVRPGRSRPDNARDDLEHDRERRRLRRGLAFQHADASRSIARPACSSTCSGAAPGAARASGVGRPPYRTSTALLARFLGMAAADSAITEYARGRGLRWPDGDLVRPTPSSSTLSRRSSPGQSAPPRRASWWPPWSRRRR